MNIRELSTIEESTWDEYTTHPLQSFYWGTIRENTGLKVVRFGCFENEQMVDVYQMTLHLVPYTKYSIGYIPRSKMPDETFLKYLKEYCKRYKIICITFEPDVLVGASVPTGLSVSPNPLFYKWTRMIDLSKSIDELKKELESGTRYNIGLAERKGVVVSEEFGDQAFNNFYNLYEDTTKRQNFGGHTRKYHEIIWNIFSKQGMAHILVAKFAGRSLAACELWLYKNTLYYTYAGSSNEDRNVKAMNALMWGVVEFGKKHGATKLDLWGIAPPDNISSKNAWAGFSEFKKGYGGKPLEMCGSFDLVVFPVFYRLYVVAYVLRKSITRLFH